MTSKRKESNVKLEIKNVRRKISKISDSDQELNRVICELKIDTGTVRRGHDKGRKEEH